MRRTFALMLATASVLSAPGAVAEVISVAPRDTEGLIEALEHAERTPGPDIIELAPRSLYALTRALEGDQPLGLPAVHGDVRILGNGSEIRRYSNASMLLLWVASSGNLRLEHLTLAEGDRGAIVNHGQLRLFHVAVVDNTAHGADAIVRNYGELEATDSVFGYNQIAGAQRDAGTILNFGRIELVRSRIESNAVSRRYGTLAEASAILNYGQVHLDRVALRSNDAQGEHEGDAAAPVRCSISATAV
jgi:hypothetical protein